VIRWVAIIAAVVVLAWILTLVGRRRLDLRYAVLWAAVGIVVVACAAWPGLLTWTARAAGFEVPVNLLFFGGILLLLGVSVHLSVELTTVEKRLERLAEELAVLKALGPAPDAAGRRGTSQDTSR
jgi:hypothetical protein